MLGLRISEHLEVPIGGPAMRTAMIDLTALGSVAVLTCVVISVATLLLVQRRRLTALLILAATGSGSEAVTLLKLHVARARPTIVPHLVEAHGLSFPSGHSAGSAMVYLTIAGLMTQVTRSAAVRRYVLLVAVLLVGTIGFSRVYLGVHWPSDVMAGWSFGTLWALGWWKLGALSRETVGTEGEQAFG